MTANADFLQACNSAASFPKSLVNQNTYEHVKTTYISRLDEAENQLFCKEDKASVELWEYRDMSTGTQNVAMQTIPRNLLNKKGFTSSHISRNQEVVKNLMGAQPFSQVDPYCRFMYLFISPIYPRSYLIIR
jgi:hypothetical protein